jgi:hypothetical protein
VSASQFGSSSIPPPTVAQSFTPSDGFPVSGVCLIHLASYKEVSWHQKAQARIQPGFYFCSAVYEMVNLNKSLNPDKSQFFLL